MAVLQVTLLAVRLAGISGISWWVALAPLTIGLTALLCILSARPPLDGEHLIKRPSNLTALLSAAQVWLLATRYLLADWAPGISQWPWWMFWSPSLILMMVFAIRAIGSESKSLRIKAS
ncbi:hypothetical protein [Sulfuriroseicoccus oceanibius]|uniref:Uncharacterized protein n=1 Tax=Sulfuriroseicoccus oceanibius TaxID=2707525 RepID=A0A6B3L6M2_9BACT|nr:hypothetical protein [Sulfuriroseicoccus oceanibius]QQL43712.1 hypothetical protein G3M56_007310 [Sulfuriroseicoccus oceanibius]